MAVVDMTILAVVGLGLWQGFWRGFVAQAFHIVSVILALVVAFFLSSMVGGWFEQQLRLPLSYARPLALALVFFLLAFIFQFFAGLVQKLIAPILAANPINR